MQNYSKIEKLLHDFILNKKFINKSLFELEKIIYLKKIGIKDQSHIFITGLPRSGTTSLLNFLYSSNQYASLTYKSMMIFNCSCQFSIGKILNTSINTQGEPFSRLGRLDTFYILNDSI